MNIEMQVATYDQTKEVLNQAVADLSVAMSIIRQAHWYMRGEGFMSLHAKMDKLNDQLAVHLDELSERLIMLGGAPYSSLTEFMEASNLTEEVGSFDLSMAERLRKLVTVYQYLASLYRTGLDITDREGDDVSNGLFADALAEADKMIWMLQAELGQAARD